MSSIHAFVPRRSTPQRSTGGPACSATIIIFPGVRYERTEADGDPAGKRTQDEPATTAPQA